MIDFAIDQTVMGMKYAYLLLIAPLLGLDHPILYVILLWALAMKRTGMIMFACVALSNIYKDW